MRLLALLILAQLLFAKELILSYKVDFGVFGKGVATVTIIENNNTYEIELVAFPQGFLKTLTASRVEKYKSIGRIEDSIFVPDFYITMRENRFKTKKNTYMFDHTNNKITIKKERYNKKENEKFFDNLKFYKKEDILTLLFNSKNRIQIGKKLKFVAVGANKENGEVEILSHLDEHNNTILNVSIKEKELDKLSIKLNREFIPIEAILEDVDIFGDIKAILIDKVNK